VTLSGQVFRAIPVSILFVQFFGSTAGSKLAKVGSVDVLAEQQVAGMDVATLASNDPHALGNWIKAHGYGWSPELEAWVRPYVAKGWKINAFRYLKSDKSTDAFSSKLVNMTFQSDAPYFPYSEPRSTSTYVPESRTLHVFFLSASRESGALASNPKNVVWPGSVDYASPLPDGQLTTIAGQLNVDDARLPAGTWLTAFMDKSNPRPGVADVTFSPSGDTAKVIPPVVDNRMFENYPFPVEIVTVPLCLVLWFVGNCLPYRPRRAMLVTSISIVGGNIGMIAGNVAAFAVGVSLGWRIWHDSPLATMEIVVGLCTVIGLIMGARRGLQRVNGRLP
jgi:hypothetical protein